MADTSITSEQGEQIITLLEKIAYHLDSLTPDVERIEANTSTTAELLREISLTVSNIESQ
jgi:hypothetical protein